MRRRRRTPAKWCEWKQTCPHFHVLKGGSIERSYAPPYQLLQNEVSSAEDNKHHDRLNFHHGIPQPVALVASLAC